MTIDLLTCIGVLWMPAAPNPVAAGDAHGFTASEIRQVLGGAVLSKSLDENSDKELAGVVAIVFRQPVAELAAALIEGHWLRDDPKVGPLHVWKPDEPGGPAFAAMQLGANDREEIERFLRASPGGALNLADSEIASFGRLAAQPGAPGDAAARAVSGVLQAVLHERHEAYRKNGLKGIAAYARGKTEAVSPGAELARAIESSLPADRLPGIARALLRYPADPFPGMEHRFFCYRQQMEDRPAFILSHRAAVRGESVALITEQRYYVSHTYDCRFIASECIAVPGGTLLFYVNRTFTDKVAGLGSGLRHGIGRKRMLANVSENLKRLRDSSLK